VVCRCWWRANQERHGELVKYRDSTPHPTVSFHVPPLGWGSRPSALDWFRLRMPHSTAAMCGLLFEGRQNYDEQRRLSTMLPACGHRCIRVTRAIGPRNMCTSVWTALTWPIHYQPTREGCMLGYCPDMLANSAAACWC
jgi:hypothetical protein